jgi:hypothetical protein
MWVVGMPCGNLVGYISEAKFVAWQPPSWGHGSSFAGELLPDSQVSGAWRSSSKTGVLIVDANTA